jgi:hypothetical protein
MLEHLMRNRTGTNIVESPDRFARDLMAQLAGHDMLKAKGISLVAASAPTYFIEDTPTAVLVRQVLGALSSRRRLLSQSWRPHTGASGEGRKSHFEVHPDLVKLATLARKKPKGES